MNRLVRNCNFKRYDEFSSILVWYWPQIKEASNCFKSVKLSNCTSGLRQLWRLSLYKFRIVRQSIWDAAFGSPIKISFDFIIYVIPQFCWNESKNGILHIILLMAPAWALILNINTINYVVSYFSPKL